MERPVTAIFTRDGEVGMVLPELEALKLEQVPYPLKAFTFNDNPATWEGVYQQAVDCFGLNGKTIGVEPTRLRVLELRLFEMAAPEAVFDSAQTESGAAANAEGCRRNRPTCAGRCRRRRRALQAALPLARVGMTRARVSQRADHAAAAQRILILSSLSHQSSPAGLTALIRMPRPLTASSHPATCW